MNAAPKYTSFWFRDYGDSLLVTGRGRDSDLGSGDIIISVDGRRGYRIKEDLMLPGKKVLEVVHPLSGRIRRITYCPADGIGDASENEAIALLWLTTGAARRAIAGTKCRPPDDLDHENQRLGQQRRTLAAHLRNSLRESRCLEAELTAVHSVHSEAIAANNVLRQHLADVTADRNGLRERLDEAHRTIERLSKRLKTRRPVTHIKLGNEQYRNLTGARA